MGNRFIIFITPGFPADEGDSTCIPALQLFMRAYRENSKNEFCIITLQYPFGKGWYTWNGIPVYSCGGQNRQARVPGSIWKIVRLISKLRKKHENIVVHSFWMGYSSFTGWLLSALFDISHSCTLMGRDAISDKLYWKLFNKYQRYVTLSTFHHDVLLQAHGCSSTIIPWGLGYLPKVPLEKSVDLIGVGSLINTKSMDEFIRVVRYVQESYPLLRAKIVGDGPDKSALKDLIVDLDLHATLELVGGKSHEECLDYIARSKILVHLSSFESFGMVTIEALALSTYVVSKPVGIAKEIKEVFPVYDWKEAGEVILEILAKYELPAPKIWSIEETVDQYDQFFNQV